MIEVLVALVITSVGLLGLAMLQVQGLKFNTNAYLRTQSTLLANDIIDRIRTNPGGDYTIDITSISPPVCTSGCNENDVAKMDLITWDNTLQETLSSPTFTITQASGETELVITIMWKEGGMPVSQSWKIQA